LSPSLGWLAWLGIGVILVWSLAQPGTPGNHARLRRFTTPEISRETTLGQRFRMNRDGLNGIEFHPAAAGSLASGEITFSLIEVTDDDRPTVVRTGRVPWTAVAGQSSYRFEFAPVADSRHKSYRFDIGATAARSGIALLAARGVERYPDNALAVNGRDRWAGLIYQTATVTPSTFSALWTGRTDAGVPGKMLLALLFGNWLLIGSVLRMVNRAT
jgi:hypothetical protein